MSRLERRVLLRAAGPALAALPVAGCLSGDAGRTTSTTAGNRDRTTTARPTTATTTDPPRSAPTTRPEPEYGPWDVELANDLDEAVAVTVEIRTSDGDVVRNGTYDLDPGDAISPITVAESGEYTATIETEFDAETVEFTACKLNSDLHVDVRRTDAGRALAVTQRHQDPGTGMAGEGDLLECEE